MKKIFTSLLLVLVVLFANAQAKYIFYFIGDGMGFGAVTFTENVLAQQECLRQCNALSFSTFPNTGFATTYSASSLVTCSAASGTALACGNKTNNNYIGINAQTNENLKSIAYRLKESGYKVGITTSVSIDHATPSAFYAHQPNRNMYYDISMEIGKSGFDFFGGAGFREPTPEGKESLWNNLKENGYTVVRSLDEVNSSKSNKTVLIQPEGESAHSFPYAIDKSSTNYTLANVTEAAVKKLDNKKGFFLMVEGGMIDWASHNNDAGAMFGEMMEFSDAVKVALEFYKKYPKQTLIVITADHETGGLSIGKAEGSVLNVLNVESQNSSIYVLEDELKKPISFSMFHALVVNDLGGALSFTDEARLRDLFYQHAKKKPVDDDTECKLTETTNLSKEIGRMVSAGSGANYSTFNHTGTMVPVYAIGAGSELFRGKMDNTDIPKKIAKAARVDWK